MCEKLANVGEFRPSVRVRLPTKSDQFGYIFVAKVPFFSITSPF